MPKVTRCVRENTYALEDRKIQKRILSLSIFLVGVLDCVLGVFEEDPYSSTCIHYNASIQVYEMLSQFNDRLILVNMIKRVISVWSTNSRFSGRLYFSFSALVDQTYLQCSQNWNLQKATICSKTRLIVPGCSPCSIIICPLIRTTGLYCLFITDINVFLGHKLISKWDGLV